MKKSIFLFIAVFSILHAAAQGKWKITLNRKLLITASEPNDSVNTKLIRRADWKATNYLVVTYTEAQPSGWLHALHFADELGNDLLVKDSTSVARIPLGTLRKLYAGKKTIKIYLTINPPNPMMEAPSRMITLGILKLP